MLLVDVIAWLKEEFIKVCKSGNAKKVEATIMNGANVNIKSGYGYSALTALRKKSPASKRKRRR